MFRQMRGWTQKELGEKLNPPVQNGAINKWECGLVTNIRRDHIEQMANLFNVSVPVLEGYQEQAVYFTSEAKKTETEIAMEVIGKFERNSRHAKLLNSYNDAFADMLLKMNDMPPEQLDLLETYAKKAKEKKIQETHSGGSN